MRGSIPANGWGAISHIATMELSVGQTVRFGVLLGRDGLAGTADLSDSRCSLRVQVVSRDGSSSPF